MSLSRLLAPIDMYALFDAIDNLIDVGDELGEHPNTILKDLGILDGIPSTETTKHLTPYARLVLRRAEDATVQGDFDLVDSLSSRFLYYQFGIVTGDLVHLTWRDGQRVFMCIEDVQLEFPEGPLESPVMVFSGVALTRNRGKVVGTFRRVVTPLRTNMLLVASTPELEALCFEAAA